MGRIRIKITIKIRNWRTRAESVAYRLVGTRGQTSRRERRLGARTGSDVMAQVRPDVPFEVLVHLIKRIDGEDGTGGGVEHQAGKESAVGTLRQTRRRAAGGVNGHQHG